jgi:hypothetical protein
MKLRFILFFALLIPMLGGAAMPACTTPVRISIVEPEPGTPVGSCDVVFSANFNGTTDTSGLKVTLEGTEINKTGSVTIKDRVVRIEGFNVAPPVVTFKAFGLPYGELAFMVEIGGSSTTSPVTVSKDINPWENSFYAVNYLGASQSSPLIKYDLDKPLSQAAANKTVNINGAIGLDRVAGIVYGGLWTVDNNPIRAFNATTLDPLTNKDISGLTHSGSLAIKVNVRQRVLYFLDTVAKKFTAISVDDGNYGRMITSQVYANLASSTDTDIGDTFAIDHSQNKIFSTNGDGGPILAIDIGGINSTSGTFGKDELTGQRCRSIGNSGGMVTIDELSGRVFTFISNNTVRAFSSQSPYATIKDYTLPLSISNDCGAWYDWRVDKLYVGSGALTKLLALNLKDGTVEQVVFAGPHSLDGISLTGPAPF